MSGQPEPRLLRQRPWRLHWPLAMPPVNGEALHLVRALLWRKNGYLACAAELDGRPVAVLLLLSRWRTGRLAERQLQAIKTLQAGGVSVAPLLYRARWHGMEYLVFDGDASGWPKIADYRLDAAFPHSDPDGPLTRLGELHAAGVSLPDPAPQLLGSMCAATLADKLPLLPLQPMSPRAGTSARFAELAALLAAFPPRLDSGWPRYLAAYRAVGGDLPGSNSSLETQRDRARRRLVRRRLVDSGRESWGFVRQRSWRRTLTVARDRETALSRLLADPEVAMVAGEPLKLGTSNTVVRADAADGPVVVKRYNMKTLAVRLKRLARASRPEDAWRAIQAFYMLGIATARPQALIRAKHGVFYGLAWMVNDYVVAPSLLEKLADHHDGDLPDALAEQFATFFRAMHAAGVSHGDFKHRNLLWPESGPLLIDMDAACYHGRRGRRFRRAWRNDRRRLLANWPEDSPLRARLDALLPGESES